MVNFYPGPSKIHSQLDNWVRKALECGILERNHRSAPFMALLEETIDNFKLQQEIPEDYKVLFTSSATECWEILNQSALFGKVHFMYNGAFGKKWFKYATTNQTPFITSLRGSRFQVNQFPHDVEVDTNSLCLVHTETSNGTHIPDGYLETVPKSTFRFIDATSAMGGVKLPWYEGDAWFASVQKALGLPSGMGVLILSPRLVKKVKELNEINHYNSLITILQNFEKYQTHYTPNILSIFCLNERSKYEVSISQQHQLAENKYNNVIESLEKISHISHLVEKKELRSKSILTLKSTKKNISNLLHNAEKKQLILGRGYGEWVDETLRVANFPAHTENDFQHLLEFLNNEFQL